MILKLGIPLCLFEYNFGIAAPNIPNHIVLGGNILVLFFFQPFYCIQKYNFLFPVYRLQYKLLHEKSILTLGIIVELF